MFSCFHLHFPYPLLSNPSLGARTNIHKPFSSACLLFLYSNHTIQPHPPHPAFPLPSPSPLPFRTHALRLCRATSSTPCRQQPVLIRFATLTWSLPTRVNLARTRHLPTTWRKRQQSGCPTPYAHEKNIMMLCVARYIGGLHPR